MEYSRTNIHTHRREDLKSHVDKGSELSLKCRFWKGVLLVASSPPVGFIVVLSLMLFGDCRESVIARPLVQKDTRRTSSVIEGCGSVFLRFGLTGGLRNIT